MGVIMPPKSKLVQVLEDAKIIGVSTAFDYFYDLFIDQVANKYVNANTLMFEWSKVEAALLPNAHPSISKPIISSFDSIMKAIAPPPIAEKAIAIRRANKDILEVLSNLPKKRA